MELLFQISALSDVSGGTGHADHLACLIPNGAASGENPLVVSGLRLQPMLAGIKRRLLLPVLMDGSADTLFVFRMDQTFPRAHDIGQFVVLVAKVDFPLRR